MRYLEQLAPVVLCRFYLDNMTVIYSRKMEDGLDLSFSMADSRRYCG